MNAAGGKSPVAFESNGQLWVVSWYAPMLPPPAGRPHGASALCLTADGNVVLVSEDGAAWVLPGGRPEPGEDWRQTLEREVLEEACATVEDATLLGFTRSECVRGHELGLVLVRSQWLARVALGPWEPRFEMVGREIATPAEAFRRVLLYHESTTLRQIFSGAGLAGVVP